MAETRIARRQHSFLPWILGLALAALVIGGLLLSSNHGRRAVDGHAMPAVDTQEQQRPHPWGQRAAVVRIPAERAA